MGALSLPRAVDGERSDVAGRSGRLSVYRGGAGRPLLLIHSVNAAASAYEMRPLFERYRAHRRVIAPDLPGFGFSDRSDRPYDIRLYTDAVLDGLQVAAEEQPGVPVDVVALSLGAEFAARAALEQPARFRSLTLITPTGFQSGSDRWREAGANREVPGMSPVLGLIGRPLFSLLTRRASIRYFLKRTFGSNDVDEGLLEYDFATSHQPGAERAPFAFLSGRLFSRDVRMLYESLELPVLVLHGTRGDFKDFSDLEWTRARPNWTAHPFPTGAMPHFEAPGPFFEKLDPFLDAAGAA